MMSWQLPRDDSWRRVTRAYVAGLGHSKTSTWVSFEVLATGFAVELPYCDGNLCRILSSLRATIRRCVGHCSSSRMCTTGLQIGLGPSREISSDGCASPDNHQRVTAASPNTGRQPGQRRLSSRRSALTAASAANR